MRSVSPIFNKFNIGGPFSPVIDGNLLRMAYDSFIFTDGTDLSSAIRLQMPELPIQITKSLKVYLKVTFENGIFKQATVQDGKGSWWKGYPNIIEYSDSSKRIAKQTALYTPIFSAFEANVKPVYGQYVTIDTGEVTIYRHVNSNLMIMQTCAYFFILPAPAAPQIVESSPDDRYKSVSING